MEVLAAVLGVLHGLRTALYPEDPLERWGWHHGGVEVWSYGWIVEDVQPHPFPNELGGEG